MTKILVGGYGTGLPDLAALVPHDAACPGEGIRWFRAYFGEDPEAPIRHPVMHGVKEFAVIDENFLKEPERARDLLCEMEHHGRSYQFWIFASAEAKAKELAVARLARYLRGRDDGRP